MALNFPSNPSENDIYQFGLLTYIFKNGKWVSQSRGASQLPWYSNMEQARALWKRLAAEAGLNLVDGSFEEGAEITSSSDVVWWQAGSAIYSWHLNEAKTVPAGSTPETTGGIGAGAWVDRTDVTLRQELNSIDGAAKIKASSGETLEAIAKSAVRIQFFGGLDDGATDCAVAIANAKAAGVTQLVLRKSHSGTGTFYFAGLTATTFSGMTLYCDDNVTLDIPSYEIYSNLVPLTLIGNPTIYGRDVARGYKSYGSDINCRDLLTQFGTDKSTSKKVNLTGLYTGLYTLTSDSASAATFGIQADYQLDMSGCTGNNIGFAGYPVEVGEALSFNFLPWNLGGQQYGYGVVTATSYYFVYCDPTTPSVLYFKYKKAGQALVESTLTPPFVDSFTLNLAEISVLKVNNRTARLLLNGTSMRFSIHDIELDDDILYVGAVYRQNASANIGYVHNMRTTKDKLYGLQEFNLVTYGDSITATYINDWPRLTIDILKANGCNANLLANYAVAGENSAQQLARLQANGVGDGNLFIIAVGTNDIQGQLGAVNTLVANISAMVNIITAAGRKTIIAIPPMYISKALGGATGTDTANYQYGADYRTSIINYCLNNNIPFFEPQTTQSDISDVGNFWHRDNIHPSSLGVSTYAWLAASSILKYINSISEFAPTKLPLTFLNGAVAWTGLAPKSALSKDGTEVILSGLINMSSVNITDGINIGSIPYKHMPAADRYIKATGSNAAINAGHLRISAGGTMTLFGVTQSATSSWISLDGLRYPV